MRGPFTLADLESMKQRGSLLPTTLVSMKPPSWRPASEVLELFRTEPVVGEPVSFGRQSTSRLFTSGSGTRPILFVVAAACGLLFAIGGFAWLAARSAASKAVADANDDEYVRRQRERWGNERKKWERLAADEGRADEADENEEPPTLKPSRRPSVPRPDSVSQAPSPTPGNDAGIERKAVVVPPLDTRDSEGCKRATVWIGFELSDKQFVYATGWVYKPNLVVTSAAAASKLQTLLEASKSGPYGPVELIVRHPGGTTAISKLRPHPKYDPNQPGEQTSIAYNVAVAVVDTPLQPAYRLASDSDIDAIQAETPYLAMGFVNEVGTREPFDPVKKKVRLVNAAVEVTASDTVGRSAASSYRIQVDRAGLLVGERQNLEGAPVVSQRGNVLGVISSMKSSVRMCSIKNIRTWLEAGAPPR